jgi:uncharacterized protein YbcI
MLSILASGLPLLIQAADTGSLTGTASDQAGVKLNYVIVSLKNAVTNAETFTHSTPQGTFSLANLPVGRYTMNVSAAGFSKAQIENITIQRHQTVAVQLTLSAVESIVVQVPAGEKPANPTEDSKAIIKGEIAGLQSRLALSAEQQAQMQVILSDRQIQIAVARNDQSLAQAERREKMGTIRRAAEAKIRTLLNENQLEEYDEILRERRQLVLQKRESGLPSMAAALTTK